MTTISLTNSDKVAIIDSIYFEEVSKHNWYLIQGRNSYVATTIHYKIVYLHTFIFILAKIPNPYQGNGKYIIIDHINTDGLDCQLNNLRYLPSGENVRRSLKDRQNRCISYRPKNTWNPYLVRISVNNKRINIGTYKTMEEARKARDEYFTSQNLISN